LTAPTGAPRCSWSLDAADAEQIAFDLGGDVAFLRAAQGVFFARRESWPPLSPVLRLLRGIYEIEPQRAHFIVRNRIFSTAPVSSACFGATRVAGHRLTAGVRAADHGRRELAALPRIDAGAAAPFADPADVDPALAPIVDAARPRPDDDADWMALAARLAREVERRAETLAADARRDNPIAALLVDPAAGLLGWATNTGSRNVTSHAEVNLVERWLRGSRRPLPRGSRLYSTLKPCKMCAGLVWDAAEEPRDLLVFYAEDDPLRYARETVLDAGSMARRRVARDAADLARVLQHRVPAAR
jgi:tRNA(Arg) A34 adenosine deaminase TadA